MVSKKLTKGEIITKLISFVFVFVQSIIYVNKDYALNNISDEFGYISNAIFMARGIKYTITSMWSAYYAYGYSFVLSLFYRITDDFVSVYRLAMLFNILCLIIMYGIITKCVNILLEKQGDIVATLVAMAIWGYTANVILAKWMWAETAICMLYWLLCWSILREKKNPQINSFVHIGRIVVLLCLYSLHQRTLVIVIAYAIYILYKAVFICDVRKATRKQIISSLGTLVFFIVCFIALNEYKQYLIKEIYTHSSSVDINNYSGISSSLSSHLNVKGIIDYAGGLCGKLWYFCVGTCFLGPTAIFAFICRVYSDLISRIKKGKNGSFECSNIGFELFISMSLIGEILLTSIFMWGVPERHDTLIYGRYMEFTFGPVLLLFFYQLFFEAEVLKHQIRKVFVFSLSLSIVVAYVWGYVSNTSYKSMFSSSVVFYFFGSIPMFAIPFLIIGYRYILFSSIMTLVDKVDIKRVCVALGIFVGCVWIINANRYNANAYTYQEKLASNYADILTVIDSYSDSDVFLVCKDEFETEEANSIFNARIIQVHLYDRDIIPVYSVNDSSAPGVYLLCNKVSYDSGFIDYSEDDVVYSDGTWKIVVMDYSD